MMRFLSTLIGAAMLLTGGEQAIACAPLRTLIVNAFPSDALYLNAFTFLGESKDQKFVISFKDDRDLLKAIVVSAKLGEVDTYCIISETNNVILLKNIDDWKFTERFGLPGSGYPRCAYDAGKAFPLPSILTRSWANKELGDSTIIYIEGVNYPSYTFLISKEDDWIAIEDKNNDSSCYYARGKGVKVLEKSSRSNWLN